MISTAFLLGYCTGVAVTAFVMELVRYLKRRSRRRRLAALVEPHVQSVQDELRAAHEKAGVVFVRGPDGQDVGPFLVTLPQEEWIDGSNNGAGSH